MASTAFKTLLLGSILMLGCRSLPSSTAVGPDLAARRAELQAANERLATQLAAGDVIGGISGAIAPEGLYVSAILTLGKGPAAARTFLQRDTLNPTSRGKWSVVRLDVSADGNDGYSYGYLDVYRANGDTLPGAFKAYWRRDASGNWQALALGRGRREKGALTWLPDTLRSKATTYRFWPARDSLEARASLMATEVAFSDSSATSIRAAFMSFAAPDAGKVSGVGYVFGREAVGEEFRTPPPGFAGIAWHAEWSSVSASHDLGFNVGPVAQRNAKPGAPGGAFFTVWRRQPNGEWKYLVD